MKKTYITPSVEEIKVGVMNILAASPDFKDDPDSNVNDGEELGREDNTPSRPGIWEQGW